MDNLLHIFIKRMTENLGGGGGGGSVRVEGFLAKIPQQGYIFLMKSLDKGAFYENP